MLKVFKQVKAFLLREGKRAGGGLKCRGIGSPLMVMQAISPKENPAISEKSLPDTPMVQHDSDMSSDNIPAISQQVMTPSNGAESARVATLDAESHEATISELSSKTPADTGNDAPAIIVDKETRPKKRVKSKYWHEPGEPASPALRGCRRRARNITAAGYNDLIMVPNLVGCGVGVFEFRSQLMSSVALIMEALTGA